MVYFKHSELAEEYHVSLKTVHNWIDAAKQGKLDLRLHETNGRTYIANNPTNVSLLDKLSENGKKYRNTRHHKTATPTAAFYEIYTLRQIHDIISNLEIHHEIPRQYNYMDGGAQNWDRFAQRMEAEENPNLLKSSISLLDANLDTIDQLINGYKRINVIDIGPGNGVPAKNLLAHLSKRGLLHRYIGIDISPKMLHIVESNVKKWFGGKVKFEGYVRDITYERFDDLLVDDLLGDDTERTLNLALFLGATPMNFRSPYDSLKVICNSLGQSDLLIYTDKPDTEADRRYFNFNTPQDVGDLSPNHRMIFDLLNIDNSLYDVEMGFNEQKRVRYIRVKLKVALTIKFKFEGGERNVKFNKGDTILLWRAWHQTTLEIVSDFEKVGFTLLNASLTKDRQYLMTISGVDVRAEE